MDNFQMRIERIWLLAKTDFIQRYYGSGLGLLWALLNPLLRILVYYLVFANLIYRDAGSDFILYLFLGFTVWQYFAENTNAGLRLLKSKKYLIQNVEMQKFDLYVASAISTMFSFFLSLSVYLLFAIFFDVSYNWALIMAVPLFLTLFIVVIGASMILSTLFLYIRDLQHIWDIALLAGMWTVPVFWNYKILYDKYEVLLYANPICGILINFRYILLYNESLDWTLFAFNLVYALTILFTGLFCITRFSFKAVETQ